MPSGGPILEFFQRVTTYPPQRAGRWSPRQDTSTTHQAALDTIADMRELVIRRRADQDANTELLRGVLRRPVIHPEHDARDLLAAASEKVTRLANETITMLREKREKVVKEDGSIAARNVIARLGKGELRTDAALREQVLDVLVVHRHLIPTARRGHYMMVVPHD